VAVGIAKATATPALVVCTSGTATANLAPAVVEADRWRVPLIVLSADRPPELRDTGAHQTIDQIHMFGRWVRWFAEVGVAEGQIGASADAYWRSLAGRAVSESTGSPSGPVHLNLAMREPLIGGIHEAPTRSFAGPRTALHESPRSVDLDDLADKLGRYERGLIVAGATTESIPAAAELARHLSWPLLADPLSGCRARSETICAYDALARDETFARAHEPEIVIRVGALDTSKALAALLAKARFQVLIDPDGWWLDSRRSITDLVTADPNAALESLMGLMGPREPEPWLNSWMDTERAVQKLYDDELTTMTEPAIARAVAEALPAGSLLVVGASMPIRDLEWYSAPSTSLRVLANRGANGIDGFVSTAVGVALGADEPVVALCGDLTMLHDSNGLLIDHDADLTFVVINNSGGGIFSFFDKGIEPEHFEALYGTPQHRDFAALAAFHGIGHQLVDSLDSLHGSVTGHGVRIVEVRTDRADNVAQHQALNAKVAETLASLRHH
jgi:2-succinyl-5-enolpyruvyl-6-hydroxy-3-cyclohexene-1-carboxylate synthase